jgi:hypothetical protein
VRPGVGVVVGGVLTICDGVLVDGLGELLQSLELELQGVS